MAAGSGYCGHYESPVPPMMPDMTGDSIALVPPNAAVWPPSRGVDAILEVEMAAVLIVEGGKLHCQHVRHYKGAIPSHIFPSTEKGVGILGQAWSEQILK